MIPALEWLQSSGRLVGFGADLLNPLKETQAPERLPALKLSLSS